jgi:hypothetical protein
MGATEKRRESGAGVAMIGDIVGSGVGGAGKWGSLSVLGVEDPSRVLALFYEEGMKGLRGQHASKLIG